MNDLVEEMAEEVVNKIHSKFKNLITEKLPSPEDISIVKPEEVRKYIESNQSRTIYEISGEESLYDPCTQKILINNNSTNIEHVLTHEILHFVAGKWLKENDKMQFKAGLQINEGYFNNNQQIREVYNSELNELFNDLLVSEVLNLNIGMLLGDQKVGEEKISAFKHYVVNENIIIENLKVAYFTNNEYIFWSALEKVENLWQNMSSVNIKGLLFTGCSIKS